MNLQEKYEGINWNKIDDVIDQATWKKLTEQFWLDTRVPVGNDVNDWAKLSDMEQDLINKVFGGLTLLDTVQSESGVHSLLDDVRTQHEEAVLNNIAFMEAVHAKSYSTIFSTFNTPTEIDNIFEWVATNKRLQYKANIINDIYRNGTPLQKKSASVLLESFLFYSGFYTPLRYLGEAKMVNTAEIIKLIIRDESVHGTYIGYKYQLGFNQLPETEQKEMEQWAIDLAFKLWENETQYTAELYSEIGWTKDVNTFLEYNLNKALANLGMNPLFPTTSADVNPIVMNGISTTTSNHDFFSQVGNGYLLGKVEPVTDADYNALDKLASLV